MLKPLPVLACTAMLAASAANAVAVYDNGGPNRVGGSSFDARFQAHDFRLDAAAVLTGATIHALDLDDEGAGLPLFYAFHQDAAGLPGAVITSGLAANLVRTALGPQGGSGDPEYRLSFRFDAGVGLAADTTYWFALRHGDGSVPRNLFWSNVDSNGTALGAELIDGVWQASINEAAFTLETGTAAVPEPASWALLISGFGLVGTRLRLRRAAYSGAAQAKKRATRMTSTGFTWRGISA